MPTDHARSQNHPAENPVAVTAALVALATSLVTWGLDAVSWPSGVETALAGAVVLAAGAVGKYVQRFTQRVYYSPPPP